MDPSIFPALMRRGTPGTPSRYGSVESGAVNRKRQQSATIKSDTRIKWVTGSTRYRQRDERMKKEPLALLRGEIGVRKQYHLVQSSRFMVIQNEMHETLDRKDVSKFVSFEPFSFSLKTLQPHVCSNILVILGVGKSALYLRFTNGTFGPANTGPVVFNPPFERARSAPKCNIELGTANSTLRFF